MTEITWKEWFQRVVMDYRTSPDYYPLERMQDEDEIQDLPDPPNVPDSGPEEKAWPMLPAGSVVELESDGDQDS